MRTYKRNLAILIALVVPLSALASEGWDWTTQATPGAQNLFDENQENEEEITYDDGDLSDKIILSEVMPNPEGTDTDTEWIEIYNYGSTNVNLGNWSLDDEEGGSDPYIFPDGTIIEAQDFMVIYRTESNLSLNNDTDQVRLFDYQNELHDTVSYEGSPEGQSYARISMEGGPTLSQVPTTSLFAMLIPMAKAENISSDWTTSPWQWTNDITQGTTNPIYHFIQGEIVELIPFEDKLVLNQKGKNIEISLKGLVINDALKASLIQPGNKLSGYATLNPDKSYSLKTFEDLTQKTSPLTQTKSNWKLLYLLGIMACGASIYFFQKKKAKLNFA